MGYKLVKNFAEMAMENRKWFIRVKAMETKTLRKLAEISEDVAKKTVSPVMFKGTLFANIISHRPSSSLSMSLVASTSGASIVGGGEVRYDVMSMADHSFAIEYGIPPQGSGEGESVYEEGMFLGNYVTFDEQPGLEDWVKNKLMSEAPNKARYFLRMRAVKVGTTGFPYGYHGGVRFMETGHLAAVFSSNHILGGEMSKLNAF